MIRFSMMLLLVVGFSYVSLFAQEEKKANPKVGEIFEKMDADKDGKLSKEEFSKYFEDLMSRLPKGGNKIGNFSDRIFDRLDGDKDGKLTKEEFEKFGGGFGGLGEGKFDKEKLKELMEKFKNRKKDN
ncbi:MAG: EF-hand domain-containing protein [Gemmataceae bacterium]|jgi:Ca2+-binding EF-hand superfamily protein|nr:EF-hand domain-containing protein [Gemmataceae bacterium]